MVNINGKEWNKLESSDIQTVLLEPDFEESFYFEFKDDEVTTKKLMEEVSAFANTFGGYIFIGISDNKKIDGCTKWNEQRIHTTIHDSITPTPSFDVKKFTCNTKEVYVVRIDEGAEPPYITNNGKIYERLSSGSFTIKDSVRLSQIYSKREQQLSKMEQKISIPPISQNTNNIYGYIDSGFAMVLPDIQIGIDIFNKINLKDIAQKIKGRISSFNLTYVGNTIVFTPGGLSTPRGLLPAHTNSFIEIMVDGSARMRILLLNNNPDDSSVNMTYAITMAGLFRDVYVYIMGELFPEKMIYAKKYESLTVLKQFKPTLFYDDDVIKIRPELREENDKMLAAAQKYQEIVGVDIVVTDNRIPKTGLYTIDKRQMEDWGIEYTAESIVNELFLFSFANMGLAPAREEAEVNDTIQDNE